MNATRTTTSGALKQSATAFWAERNQRERTMLLVAGVVVVIALFYLVLIAPAMSGRADMTKRLPALRQQAAELQALSKDTAALSTKASAPVTKITRENVEASLSRQGLKAQNIVFAGEDTVRLQFTGASFSTLVSWFDHVQRSARVSVIDATIDPQTQPDTVNAGVTLRQQSAQTQ